MCNVKAFQFLRALFHDFHAIVALIVGPIFAICGTPTFIGIRAVVLRELFNFRVVGVSSSKVSNFSRVFLTYVFAFFELASQGVPPCILQCEGEVFETL